MPHAACRTGQVCVWGRVSSWCPTARRMRPMCSQWSTGSWPALSSKFTALLCLLNPIAFETVCRELTNGQIWQHKFLGFPRFWLRFFLVSKLPRFVQVWSIVASPFRSVVTGFASVALVNASKGGASRRTPATETLLQEDVHASELFAFLHLYYDSQMCRISLTGSKWINQQGYEQYATCWFAENWFLSVGLWFLFAASDPSPTSLVKQVPRGQRRSPLCQRAAWGSWLRATQQTFVLQLTCSI